MARQLSFDLPVRQALGREDFYVSPANAAAVGMIEGWQGWPASKLVLSGPAGAGKTHLACVWARLADARIIAATDLAAANINELSNTNIAVEDADKISENPESENTLFHLHNLVLAEGRSLLITAGSPPKHWGMNLPDLASRMQGSALVSLEEPDDNLLSAVLMKHFADRQLSPSLDTIPYLTRHMPRSFAAARSVVARLDRTAMDEGRAINRTLARQVLDKLPGERQTPHFPHSPT